MKLDLFKDVFLSTYVMQIECYTEKTAEVSKNLARYRSENNFIASSK